MEFGKKRPNFRHFIPVLPELLYPSVYFLYFVWPDVVVDRPARFLLLYYLTFCQNFDVFGNSLSAYLKLFSCLFNGGLGVNGICLTGGKVAI